MSSRWWIVPLVLGVGWLAWNRIHVRPVQEKLEGRKVTVSTEGWEARYRGLGHFDGTLMIFGGVADPRRTGMHDAEIEGLDMDQAGSLLERFPDFHRFASAGADQAVRLLESHQLVSANENVQRTLQRALELHEKALAASGDRVCVTVRGRHLELESVRLVEDGRDVTRELPDEVRRSDFVFAESATIVDCRPMVTKAQESPGVGG